MPIAKPFPTIFSALGTFAYVFMFFFGGAPGEEFAGEQICISKCCTVPCKYSIKDIQAFIIVCTKFGPLLWFYDDPNLL